MPKIVFRGKTYYSVYEMPPNVRRAYKKELEKAGTNTNKEKPEPTTDSLPSTPEPEVGGEYRGLLLGILVALVLSGIAFLLSRLIP